MIEIECLACGKVIKLPQFIDTDTYDGQVVCQECTSLLHVKLIKGKVQKYKIVEKKNKGEFNWTETALQIQKEKNQQQKDK